MYNKKETLKRCIDSILNQIADNYEIIIIDDGSQDGSIELINYYAQKYSVVKAIYNKRNRGLGAIRYQGANIAKGRYIVYIDADDEIEESYSKRLEDKIVNQEYDIVYVLLKVENSVGKFNISKLPSINDELTIADRRKLAMSSGVMRISGFAFRKEFIVENKIFIDGQNYNEDGISTFYPYIANKIGIINEPLYYWHYEQDSMAREVRDHYEERLKNFLYTYDYAINTGLMERYPLEIEAILVDGFYLGNIREIVKGREYIMLPEKILNECKKMIKEKWKNYLSNEYLNEYLEKQNEKNLLNLAKANDISFEAFKEEFYAKYRDCYMNKRNKIQKLLDELHNKKLNVAIWGAGLKEKTFLYYMDKEGKYIQYVIDGDRALRGREIDEYHKIYTYEDVIDLVDVILIITTLQLYK